MAVEKSVWKAGWREIGGKRCYFRSRWEANYARYLEWQKRRGDIAEWEYEPTTFYFEGLKRGKNNYKPDFLVMANDETKRYHEVKGYMDKRSKTLLDRMRRYYPDVPLEVIDGKRYRGIARTAARIVPGWE